MGCDLPGVWRLVERNGTPATSGSWEIAEGFVERSGDGSLETCNPEYPVMRGSFGADYSLDPDRPKGYDLKLWYMSVADGTIYVDLFGHIESLDGDVMVYRVQEASPKLVPTGGGIRLLPVPNLVAGTWFTFQR